MNIFQSKYFNVVLPVLFVLFLLLLLVYGCLIGIYDVITLAVNAVLMLLATLIAISLPLYASAKNEQKRRDKEHEMIYVSVSRYVGGEILDNVIEIQDILKNNEKSLGQLDKQNLSMSERDKKIVTASIWKTASEILVGSLQDKHHNNMVMSGLVAKIPDDAVGNGIRDTYQKMDNLKKRLKSITMFFGMLISPQVGVSKTFLDYQFNTKLQEGITAVELDIKIFSDSAEKTRKDINKLLKQYGKEIKIIAYEKVHNSEKGSRKTEKSSISSKK
ncbi:hypothetical protein COW99_01545 [Candidatus Roizmanbacteria bacterium CG22_combo_CG10-13_8_21_14_all_38_20]|uniref:Uncharacterized protein n=1 Tax=Candidatus Roizmanbacteria bacterium CG22_combo_CG10-13_8_21_14_all_38_20 TaxID=1974862 RepID=A0A2H0BWG7_9BACT|nr:hypothetical protein [Candidatus Microgenomates bacterium]PIP61889.1 MAG: hypothetical protein COW99_01545 [Candidatus Roizmanbacteria bacterium CG22_combo_CG10-13_8_21_14_all_38_20]PJC32136.1 MAG: hypothetical protein CO050_01410 [Candidatus Roizmanbacteria bacterium CG_4_9_14_0_2_um_filter_38_17]